MTGLPNYNFDEFNRVEEELGRYGWNVTNPASHGVIEGYEWADYIRLDLPKLVKCDSIYLLNGWHKSKGANLEYQIATAMGMNIWFQTSGIPCQNCKGVI